MGCSENSPEEAELAALTDVIEACESQRLPLGRFRAVKASRTNERLEGWKRGSIPATGLLPLALGPRPTPLTARLDPFFLLARLRAEIAAISPDCAGVVNNIRSPIK